MAEMHGAEDNRTERIEQSKTWLGAECARGSWIEDPDYSLKESQIESVVNDMANYIEACIRSGSKVVVQEDDQEIRRRVMVELQHRGIDADDIEFSRKHWCHIQKVD